VKYASGSNVTEGKLHLRK